MKTTETTQLLDTLQAQRDHVVGILEGLDEADARRSVVPSGWNAIQLVSHLTLDDERFWCSAVVAADPAAIEAIDPTQDGWQIPPTRSLAEAIETYRAQCARSTAILATAHLDSRPGWWPDDVFGDWRLDDVRAVILHLITETATHAGHLDVAREFLDRRQWIVL